ncbi:porin family protein [Spirosoma luteum]|uniref:porin family protein n=1 Tax=Spirosoma luteum TaxID=431553 RepID=UPI0012F79929|nr:porin family protein [Spirosoma luteum]
MLSTIKSLTAAVVTALLMAASFKSFSQTNRFNVSVNSLTTNFNYGKSNSDFKPYKKDFKGFQIGVAYQAGITPIFSVVPEVYFAIKGGSLERNNQLTVNKSTLRLYTVEAPILARLHYNNLYLNAGPYVSYNLGGRLKTDGSDAVAETTTKISFGKSASEFNRWDFGVQAGAGYNFIMSKTTLTLDVRYGYGLVNISNDVERYNRMLNISLLVAKRYKKNRSANGG